MREEGEHSCPGGRGFSCAVCSEVRRGTRARLLSRPHATANVITSARLHLLHVMGSRSRVVEKNDVVTCFLRWTNLTKRAPIWQPSLSGNSKRDTAAVGRTFLRAPPQLLFGLLR